MAKWWEKLAGTDGCRSASSIWPLSIRLFRWRWAPKTILDARCYRRGVWQSTVPPANSVLMVNASGLVNPPERHLQFCNRLPPLLRGDQPLSAFQLAPLDLGRSGDRRKALRSVRRLEELGPQILESAGEGLAPFGLRLVADGEVI